MNLVPRIVRAVALALLVLAVPCGSAIAGPDPQQRWVTLSAPGVILPGDTFTDVLLPVPVCGSPKEFLVLGLEVAPEVFVGSTPIDVVNLPSWAAWLPVFQHYTSGVTTAVSLTVIGQGPQHLSVTLPAGQSSGTAGTVSPIGVRITLLGGVQAPVRFEFNVHVTGSCGVASILTPAGRG